MYRGKFENQTDKLQRLQKKTNLLLIACLQKNNYDASKLLLEQGANPNTYFDGQYCLHYACLSKNLLLVKLLLNFGADINKKDDYEDTPLHIAIKQIHNDLVKLLLFRKANPNAQTSYNTTPLHIAVKNQDHETIQDLLHYKADPHIKDLNGNNALYIACQYNATPIIKLLIKNGVTFGKNLDLIERIEMALCADTTVLKKHNFFPKKVISYSNYAIGLAMSVTGFIIGSWTYGSTIIPDDQDPLLFY